MTRMRIVLIVMKREEILTDQLEDKKSVFNRIEKNSIGLGRLYGTTNGVLVTPKPTRSKPIFFKYCDLKTGDVLWKAISL